LFYLLQIQTFLLLLKNLLLFLLLAYFLYQFYSDSQLFVLQLLICPPLANPLPKPKPKRAGKVFQNRHLLCGSSPTSLYRAVCVTHETPSVFQRKKPFPCLSKRLFLYFQAHYYAFCSNLSMTDCTNSIVKSVMLAICSTEKPIFRRIFIMVIS
jgi:hypothetical protein